MILVGSRTGGYEYFVRTPKEDVWLGQRPRSDYDFVVDNPRHWKGADFFKGPAWGPCVVDDMLIRPPGFSYLNFPLFFKLWRRNRLDCLRQIVGQKVEVYDAGKGLVGSFYFCRDHIPIRFWSAVHHGNA